MKKSIHSRTFIMLLAFLVIASLVPFLTGCGGGDSGSGGSSYYGGGGGDAGTATTSTATTAVSCGVELPSGSGYQPGDLTVQTGQQSAQVNSNGSASSSLNVSTERAQLVGAVDKNGSPVLLSINVPQSKTKDGSVKLDATSTALALVYLNPLVCQIDATLAKETYNILINLPELSTLANLISSKMALVQGTILTTEDSDIEKAMGDVFTAYHNALNKKAALRYNAALSRPSGHRANENPVFYVTVQPTEVYNITVTPTDNKLSIWNHNDTSPVYMYMDSDPDLGETLLNPKENINVTITGYAGNSKTLKVMGWGAYGDYPTAATARDKELIDELKILTIRNGVVNSYKVVTGSISDSIKSAGDSAVKLFQQENPSDPNGTNTDERTLGQKLKDYAFNFLPKDLQEAAKILSLVKEKCPVAINSQIGEKDVFSNKFLQKFTINCVAYPDTVAAPVFSPAGGTYSSAQTITLTTTTDGAEIYYAISTGYGTDMQFTKYNSPLNVSQTSTVYAYAKKTGMTDSATKSATYTIGSTPPPGDKVAAPVFSPAGGTYSSAQTITLTTTTEGAEIWYSTDNSNWTKYSSDIMFQVSTTTTFYAYAKKTGMTDSSVTSATYTIETTPSEKVAAPEFSPAGGTYSSPKTITLTTTTKGAEILYSTSSVNGPWTTGTSLQVSTTTTVYAYAKKTGMTDSDVASASYTIEPTPTPSIVGSWKLNYTYSSWPDYPSTADLAFYDDGTFDAYSRGNESGHWSLTGNQIQWKFDEYPHTVYTGYLSSKNYMEGTLVDDRGEKGTWNASKQ
ncbi:MAG: chitobiase/beta-hexosaminidase C-terminal domain-containing protein [Vulcanimicrobiota bacterium]